MVRLLWAFLLIGVAAALFVVSKINLERDFSREINKHCFIDEVALRLSVEYIEEGGYLEEEDFYKFIRIRLDDFLQNCELLIVGRKHFYDGDLEPLKYKRVSSDAARLYYKNDTDCGDRDDCIVLERGKVSSK